MTEHLALIPMKWADNPEIDELSRCACCGKPLKGDPKHWVEVTGDMEHAVSPGLNLDPSESGGYFPVGPDCARKYLRGFIHHG